MFSAALPTVSNGPIDIDRSVMKNRYVYTEMLSKSGGPLDQDSNMAKSYRNIVASTPDQVGPTRTSQDQREVDAPLLAALVASLRLGLSLRVALALEPDIEGPRFCHEYRAELAKARAEWRKQKHIDMDSRIKTFDEALKFMERKDSREWRSPDTKLREKMGPDKVTVNNQQLAVTVTKTPAELRSEIQALVEKNPELLILLAPEKKT